MRTVLHVAPHPDDECVGAPGTLLSLVDAGARVIVVACGLGRPGDHHRRRRELVAATAAGGFGLIVRQPPEALSASDDLATAHAALVPWLRELIDELDADLVISPQLHDVHPAHETVARALRDAIPAARRPPVWWMWGIWADLPVPTILVPCSAQLVERSLAMLACHAGELARNDYADLVRAAGRLNAIRGVERVLGFGSTRLADVRHAELLTEIGWDGRIWRIGVPRVAHTPGLPADWRGDVSALLSATRPGV
ncbi:MAG TPA: PIG-L family deacetylase [Pseudonocardiaceae bacterium]|jgi:LmbE family N-acetylglucosaminyl deacetylase